MPPFSLDPCKRLTRALRYEVALYFGGEPEGECQHFRLYVIAEAVAVLDGPDTAPAPHAEAEDFHNHVEASAQSAQFAADDDVSVLYLLEQFPEPALGVSTCAGNGFLNPAVNTPPLPGAEVDDFETLVLYSLFVAADADVSILHICKI